MGISGEILAASSGSPDLLKLAGAATVAGIGQKFLKPYVRIEQGHEAVRTRSGRPCVYKFGERKGTVKIWGAGPHLMIPFAHKVHEVSVRDQATALQSVRIDRTELQYDVEASMIWRVQSSNAGRGRWSRLRSTKPWRSTQTNEHPYSALFETDDTERTVKELCVDGLRRCMVDADEGEFRDSKAVTESVQALCATDLERYGTELVRITIASVSETGVDRLGRHLGGNWTPPNMGSVVAGVAVALEGSRPGLHLVESLEATPHPDPA